MQDPNHGEFQHQYFHRDYPELLSKIKRKVNSKAAEGSKKYQKHQQAASTEQHDPDALDANDQHMAMDNTDAHGQVLAQLANQIELGHYSDDHDSSAHARNESNFEHRLEQKLSQIERENQMLKSLCVETHNSNIAMRNMLQSMVGTLYGLFKGSGAASGGDRQSLMQKSNVRTTPFAVYLSHLFCVANDDF